MATFAASLLASLVIGGSALAVSRSVVSPNIGGEVPAIPPFFASTKFTAHYTVTSIEDKQSTYWLLQNFDLTAFVSDGKRCFVCDDWYYSADVTFLNAAGHTVASFKNPPSYSCGAGAAPSEAMVFSRCESLYEAPYSATKDEDPLDHRGQFHLAMSGIGRRRELAVIDRNRCGASGGSH